MLSLQSLFERLHGLLDVLVLIGYLAKHPQRAMLRSLITPSQFREQVVSVEDQEVILEVKDFRCTIGIAAFDVVAANTLGNAVSKASTTRRTASSTSAFPVEVDSMILVTTLL